MNIFNLKQRLFMYMCMIVLVGSQFLFLFWAFWPYQPIVLHDLEIIGTPKAGEYFTYRLDYTKNMRVPGTITKQFVDGFVVALPSISSNIPLGHRQSVHSVFLPKIPSGTYYFIWTGTYAVNPIREVSVTIRSKCFTIGDGKECKL